MQIYLSNLHFFLTFAADKPKYKQNYGRLPGGQLRFVKAGDSEQGC
jgi:hypothetical protein